ncbi:tyrosine-type recombinase/integrase [Bacillus glycinifermentans]|uniref:tyrosine-type recombinase/integrase n=1 Tax=Bacillus glycinifermentans TaxID=1664069 RepID=UPI0015824FA1|nr:tyrosine-type recombinase/integrase [Bacillus glycinifermentans]
MAKLDNLVQFNAKSEDKNVYGTIRTYLLRKGQNSKNTLETYERHIRDFFKTMRGKEITDLVEDDLIFTKKQIETYQVSLKERHKGTTVNNAMSAIRECYKRLADDGFNVDIAWFNLERYDEHDKESYDSLTYEEVVHSIELVSKTRKGREKALLIRVAYATAWRLKSILDLEFDDIVNINDIWYIRTMGKGNKWSYKKLSADLYNELMSFKEEVKRDKIFQLTEKTIKRMMNYIRSNIDFGHRRIVFHSFKKASIDEVNILSGGDIKLMQAHGDHANASTTLNDYASKKKLEELLIVDVNTNIPIEKFEEMSKEELVDLIRKADRTTQIRLLKKAGHM